MHFFIRVLSIVAAMILSPLAALAETTTLDVTVSYRERIALPPDAQLEVQLVDVAGAGEGALGTRVASQRHAMTGVPATVSLPYDGRIIGNRADYVVTASIWSGNEPVFRTTRRYPAFPETGAADGVEIVLNMVQAEEGESPSRSIAGIMWAVTEVLGEPWANDDPATLMIDDTMGFSVFGGCNRFNGGLVPLDGGIAFPESFAGTLMACPPATEALERSFLDALRRVAGYVRYGGGLVMMDARGNAVLHFEEGPE